MKGRQGTQGNFFPAFLAFLVFPVVASAAVSEGSGKRLEAAETNQGGPGASSASGKRQQISVGSSFSGGKLTSSRFRLNVGFLATSLTGEEVTPTEELDLTVLEAKTSAGGTLIPPATWQPDADPYFRWEPPPSGVEVAGYSYAIDAEPDDALDTQGTSWDVATDPIDRLSDGQHTFAVKAIGLSGLTGTSLNVAVWVDTTKPTITNHSPTGASWLNTLSPALSAVLLDVSSGIDASSVQVSINNQAVPASGITIGSSTGVIPPPASWPEASLTNGEAAASQPLAGGGMMTAQPSGLFQQGDNTIKVELSDLAGNDATPLVWSLRIDTEPPTGTIVINSDAQGLGAEMTTSVYVTLTLSASDSDEGSGVTSMLLSNNRTDYAQEPFLSMKEWKLMPISDLHRTVWVKYQDAAGNVSEAVADEIQLVLLAPETMIIGGPAGITQDPSGEFTFDCSLEEGCVYSYQYDNEEWSDATSGWLPSTTASPSVALPIGNHYFRVKAAKDTNGHAGIQLEEEDPTPAERAWIIGVEAPVPVGPGGPPIKLWRID